MSRRRGVVLSDDESSAPPPSRSSNSHSAPRKERPRASAPEAPVLDLKEVAKLSPEEVQKLRLLTGDIQPLYQIITTAMGVVSDSAVAIEELPVSERNTERVELLEKSLRDLIDATQHIRHSTTAIEQTANASEDSAEPTALHEIFINGKTTQDRQYNAKSAEERYANVAEFQDFKRRVWDVNHENVPQPSTWFPSRNSAVDEDDDLVVDQEIQSLKCPITLTLLEKPVRNTNCVHVYSLDAIKELVRQGRGKCNCPVAGCAAEVTMKGVREDKAMARKIREEKAREDERIAEGRGDAQEITEGMSEIIYEDDDVKLER